MKIVSFDGSVLLCGENFNVSISQQQHSVRHLLHCIIIVIESIEQCHHCPQSI